MSHSNSDVDDDEGDDQDTSEADGRLQLVTECWVEPQSGTIIDPPKQCQVFNGLHYYAIPRAVRVVCSVCCFVLIYKLLGEGDCSCLIV